MERKIIELKSACSAFVIALTLALAGCDSPQKAAQRELSRRAVEPSGSSLVAAVSAGDAELVALLLEAGATTEAHNQSGLTPLGIAIGNRDKQNAAMLLNAGADPNASHHRADLLGTAATFSDRWYFHALLANRAAWDGELPGGEKILPWAIRTGKFELVESLFRAGADPHFTDRGGKPVLYVAMEAGHKELTRTLLQLGADPGNRPPEGRSPLELALHHGWRDLFPMLIRAGADPNAQAPDGTTLLGRALAAGDAELFELLLAHGADPEIPWKTGDISPFDEAVIAADGELLERFLAHGFTPREGWCAVADELTARSEIGKLRLLFRYGLRPGVSDRHGFRPLETAAATGNFSLARLFLDYSLPPGRAVYFAAASGNHEVLALLLARGLPAGNPAVPSRDTPASAALRNGHDLCAAALIEKITRGNPPGAPVPDGSSLFHLAVVKGCAVTVSRLLEAGVDPNLPVASPAPKDFWKLVPPGALRWSLAYDRNVTPLMLAAGSGDIRTARLLLRAGAKTNVRTRVGSLWPINFASQRADIPMMRLFLGQNPHTRERTILVKLGEQLASVFDETGTEIFKTRISTGRKGFATPTGNFAITNKYRDWTSTLYDASMPFFQRLSCGDFGFHQGNVPGYPASHGCIRVPAGNAAKLFSLTRTGDHVRIIP